MKIERARDMKYALLVYQPHGFWDDMPMPARDEIFREFLRIQGRHESLTLLGMQPPESGTTVRVDHNGMSLTDGPVQDTPEYLGGVYVLEAESLDDALGVAGQVSAARCGGAIEVRPIAELTSEPK
jgi:hypothetical protein